MPELPEVETIRRQLHQQLAGATIRSMELLRSGRESPMGEEFKKRLKGKTIERVERRAKLLIWRFTNDEALAAHLKMTGRFVFVGDDYTPTKHDRIIFHFDGKRSLVWSDVRQFGFLRLFSNASEVEVILSAYGPEPLEVEAAHLAEQLDRLSNRTVKAALLDQAVIAGVGNIYADESLHRAGIRPTRRLSSLTSAERLRLAQEIQTILAESIAQQGTSANDYVDTRGEKGGFLDLLRVYGRSQKSCRECQTLIKKIVLAQRGTHYCPSCQK